MVALDEQFPPQKKLGLDPPLRATMRVAWLPTMRVDPLTRSTGKCTANPTVLTVSRGHCSPSPASTTKCRPHRGRYISLVLMSERLRLRRRRHPALLRRGHTGSERRLGSIRGAAWLTSSPARLASGESRQFLLICECFQQSACERQCDGS